MVSVNDLPSIRRHRSVRGRLPRQSFCASFPPYRWQNKLDLALQELGRIERTLFTLDWLEQPNYDAPAKPV